MGTDPATQMPRELRGFPVPFYDLRIKHFQSSNYANFFSEKHDRRFAVIEETNNMPSPIVSSLSSENTFLTVYVFIRPRLDSRIIAHNLFALSDLCVIVRGSRGRNEAVLIDCPLCSCKGSVASTSASRAVKESTRTRWCREPALLGRCGACTMDESRCVFRCCGKHPNRIVQVGVGQILPTSPM